MIKTLRLFIVAMSNGESVLRVISVFIGNLVARRSAISATVFKTVFSPDKSALSCNNIQQQQSVSPISKTLRHFSYLKRDIYMRAHTHTWGERTEKNRLACLAGTVAGFSS